MNWCIEVFNDCMKFGLVRIGLCNFFESKEVYLFVILILIFFVEGRKI